LLSHMIINGIDSKKIPGISLFSNIYAYLII
jgi:hypothetical protein